MLTLKLIHNSTLYKITRRVDDIYKSHFCQFSLEKGTGLPCWRLGLLNVFILQLISWTRFCHSINYWPSHRGHKHTHCRVYPLLILEENTKISSDLFGPKTHTNTKTHSTVECVHTVESKHKTEKWSIWSTQSPVCTRSGYHQSWAIYQTFWFN